DLNLYGSTYKAGALGFGTIFRVTTNGSLTTLLSFNSTNGSFPYAGLLQSPDGNYLGTTSAGGTSNAGTIIRMTPSGVRNVLYSFNGSSDGATPAGELLQANDGNFYGTTVYGGTYNQGTVFRFAPDGTLTTVAHFDGYNGANPRAALLQTIDG